jgi:DNA recombination protein RmuC
MDNALLIIIVLLIGLAIGVGIGWFAGSRPVADWRARFAERDEAAKELDAKFLRTFADLEAAREKAGRVDGLEAKLDHANARLADLNAERGGF